MNFWLISLPRPDLMHCIKIGTFGLGRKQRISDLRQGDKIICCAGKGEWKVIASGEATTDYYVDDKPVFLKEGSFLDRFDFKADMYKEEFDLKSILDQLSFVTNIAYWPVYFKSGLAKLNQADWTLIEAVSEKVKSSYGQK